VFVGPFARCFPKARVFVAPHQWSYPLNLPLSWLGLPWGRTQVLPENSADTPFGDQFDYAILGPIKLGLGSFEEVVLFDRRSRTLLVTDSVISVPDDPPAIVQLDPYPLLFHARDNVSDVIEDNSANRRKGWHRIVLFSLYFQPSILETIKLRQAWRDARKAPDRSRRAYFGLFPFKWKENWQRSFDALRGEGSLFVAPILQTLILNRAPQETLDWADRVVRWDFQRIIPCHFDSPIETNPIEFRRAFTFLEKHASASQGSGLIRADFELLQKIEVSLIERGITLPPKEKV
jgi:hypothetical protein